MANKINLKIMTPSGIFWDKPVDIVTVKTTEGYIGLQAGHIPFVASLDIAEMTLNSARDSEHKVCAIAGGLVYGSQTEISIITDAIEYKDKIDVTRAERARKAAEAIIRASKSEAENFNAQLALKKAINRIHVRTGK